MADVATFAGDRLDQEAPHRIVADARNQSRLEAQPGAAERGVGRRAPQVFREARDVLEPRADLLRIEIDAEAAQADDIEGASVDKASGITHGDSGSGIC